MRDISVDMIIATVARLFTDAAYRLPDDVLRALRAASDLETEAQAASVLKTIEKNALVASEGGYPLCQDCGMAVVFLDVGQDVRFVGGDLFEAVNEGVRRAYRDGYLRCSIVEDPLYERINTGDNTPAKLHIRIVPGREVKITVTPKGFGSENMSALAMLPPAAGERGVIEFVVETVGRAGPNPCPPVVVGVGIGSDFEGVAELAKRALLRPIGEHNPLPSYAALEEKLLEEINSLGIGAAGYGGRITALGISVEQAPTHIASLPVAVNICCHSNRHAATVI